MNKTSIWRRIATAQATSVVLLLTVCVLAIWLEWAKSASAEFTAQTRASSDKINHDILLMSDGLRSCLLDPAGGMETNRMREAEADLTASMKTLESLCADQWDLLRALNEVRNYLQDRIRPFQVQTLALLGSDSEAAREYYRKNVRDLHVQRDLRLNKLAGAVQDVITARAIQAQHTALVGLLLMLAVLVVFFIVGRLQAAAVARPLNQLTAALERMRQGDFTQRVRLDGRDDFRVIGDGLNRLADDLSRLVGQVQRSGLQVNMTSTEISATAKEQQSTATEIAATTAEIGATSKQISATSKELVKTMNEVSQVAEDTAHVANTGQAAIARMETNMRQIMEASSSITAKLAVLSEKTANIGSVVTTITKVADQTNLLSLNAAIEAEKAGEYGLGFAVVAMEIRRLADQTAVSTYDIEKMVKEMQSAVAAGVMGMDKFSEEVRRGVEEIRQVSTQLAQIIHQVQTLTPRFQTVNEGMNAQATGAQQISETLTQLNESAQQTADSLRQSSIAIEQLNAAAGGLQTSIARFRLDSAK